MSASILSSGIIWPHSQTHKTIIIIIIIIVIITVVVVIFYLPAGPERQNDCS